MRYFWNRLREPSTMAGLSALAMIFGVAPNTINLATQVAVGAAGLLAIVVPEAKATP